VFSTEVNFAEMENRGGEEKGNVVPRPPHGGVGARKRPLYWGEGVDAFPACQALSCSVHLTWKSHGEISIPPSSLGV
jgi:hypothetical protein